MNSAESLQKEKENVPTQDRELFDKVVFDVRSRPDFYKEGGQWLDDHYGPEAWKELQKKHIQRAKNNGSSIYVRLGDWKDTGFCNTSWYAFDVISKRSYEGILTEIEAKVILVLTWLVWDREANHLGLNITAFERWDWGEDPFNDMKCRNFASFFWIHRYGDKWPDLVRRAIERIRTVSGRNDHWSDLQKEIISLMKNRKSDEERLTQDRIAELLGRDTVSGCVKEDLSALVKEGVLVNKRGKGYFLKTVII